MMTYSVFSDVLSKFTRRLHQVIKEEFLLHVLILLQEVPDGVSDSSCIVLDSKLYRPQPLVCPLDEILVASQLTVQLLQESLVSSL